MFGAYHAGAAWPSAYALFPQVATDFFKYRLAQQEKVDVTAADTKNGAYPV